MTRWTCQACSTTFMAGVVDRCPTCSGTDVGQDHVARVRGGVILPGYSPPIQGVFVECDTAGMGPAVTVDPITGTETITAPGEPLQVIEQAEGTPLEPAVEEEGSWAGSSSSTSPARPPKSDGPSKPSRPKRVPGMGSRFRRGQGGSSSASSTGTSGPETGG